MISVIVPSYNTKDLLMQCLDSILSQTYKDFEVLVIDNCSTDGTYEVIKYYEQLDKRVKGIIQKSSVTEARNIGLCLAHGEFISFVDSDDLIVDTFMEKLIYLINLSNADIALFKWFEIDGELRNDVKIVYPTTGKTMSTTEAISYCITHVNEKNNAYIWNKFFRRKSFIKNDKLILFDTTINYAEDALWLVKVMLNAGKAVFLNESLYGYRCSRLGNNTSSVWMGGQSRNINLEYMRSGVMAFFEASLLLKKCNSYASNNSLQKSLSHRINGMKAAVFLHNNVAFYFFKEKTNIMLWRFFVSDWTVVGFAWCLKKTLEYYCCCIKQLFAK